MKRIALSGGWTWLAGVVLLTSAIVVLGATVQHFLRHPPRQASPSPSASVVMHFRTLSPGARLPSGAQCARWVRASPDLEIRPGNQTFNRTVGHRVAPGFLPAGDRPRATSLAARINGDFTGTTREILRWAACKWGIDQNIVFAQAAAESSWQQDKLGDWGTDGTRCPPGHGLGANGHPGECPQSYGILQDRYPYWSAAWPGIAASTAMNADVAYAVWRSCYDGYEIWLRNTAPPAHPYHAGELWGCVGRWFAGSWYTPAADSYIRRVQELLQQRVWDQPRFARVGLSDFGS